MSHSISFPAILITIMMGFSIHADVTPDTSLKQAIDDIVIGKKAVTELAGIQMVLLKQGKIVFEHAVGMAHVDDAGIITPLTNSHKVRVASISKFVMALGFMTLVEKGQIDLDRDVSDYLGFKLRNPNFPHQKITARQLLSHTSSVRDAGHYFLTYGEDFQDFFKPSKHYQNGAHFANDLAQAPGEYFQYANLNFGLLAGVIESVSKQRFDLFMEQVIFEPLALNVSFNSCRFSNKTHQYIGTLYRRGVGGDVWAPDGPWIAQVDDTERSCYYGGPKVSSNTNHSLNELSPYIPGSNPTLFSPQGGLRASAHDLATLVELILEGKDLVSKQSPTVLSKEIIEQMLTPVWQLKEGINNGHTGGEAPVDDISSMGLKKAYGLSTHIINLKDWHLTSDNSIWYGHMAAAYGLLGQLWFNPKTKEGIVILLAGMGDDPSLPKKSTPMDEVEAQVLRLALKGLSSID